MQCVWNFVSGCIPWCTKKEDPKKNATKSYPEHLNTVSSLRASKITPCKQQSLEKTNENIHNTSDQKNTTMNIVSQQESCEEQMKKLSQELLSMRTQSLTMTTSRESLGLYGNTNKIIERYRNSVKHLTNLTTSKSRNRKNITIDSNLPAYNTNFKNVKSKNEQRICLTPKNDAASTYFTDDFENRSNDKISALSKFKEEVYSPYIDSDEKVIGSTKKPPVPYISRKKPS